MRSADWRAVSYPRGFWELDGGGGAKPEPVAPSGFRARGTLRKRRSQGGAAHERITVSAFRRGLGFWELAS